MKRKTIAEFKEEFYKLAGNEYSLLSKEYINNKTKVKVCHNKCGKDYEVTPHNFLIGQRCPYCYGKFKKDNNTFKREIKELTNGEYIPLTDYKSSREKVLFKHLKCNKEFEMKPNNFQQGQRCPYCYGKFKKTTEIFKKEVYNLVKDEYVVLGEYKTTMNKILMKHNKCNNEYYVTPNDFLSNKRCPYCKRSKGEERIENWLKKNNIKYEREYKFSDCKYKRELPFDFKLEYEDGDLLLIEYDGEFHSHIQYYEEEFNLQQIRDNIKNEYCKKNNIDLIRISYKEFNNIEQILKENIK